MRKKNDEKGKKKKNRKKTTFQMKFLGSAAVILAILQGSFAAVFSGAIKVKLFIYQGKKNIKKIEETKFKRNK
jgi:hypothetical protein